MFFQEFIQDDSERWLLKCNNTLTDCALFDKNRIGTHLPINIAQINLCIVIRKEHY